MSTRADGARPYRHLLSSEPFHVLDGQAEFLLVWKRRKLPEQHRYDVHFRVMRCPVR
ncbi:hypothetical protein ACIBI9_29200 [Nonomuraea sp. NPDC050451]|uniref:hypothetical protein n=1 Tax=Nonomuraea sp. NPDC050451 TaxID=3364364 RepID=UPI00379065A4